MQNKLDEMDSLVSVMRHSREAPAENVHPEPAHPVVKKHHKKKKRTTPAASPNRKAIEDLVASPEQAGTCAAPKYVQNTDVQVDHLLDINPFRDPAGGAWTQGFDIKYDAAQWTRERPLRVFVVPHSHNDPGWIKTVDQYFEDQTNKILTNVVNALSRDPKHRFIWAEISYFSMWWARQSDSMKEMTKKVVATGQLEFVTGGWVMNDEANTHYYAMIDQLMLGQQWLLDTLGVRPKSGWAIDPFGHTPTMAYLLSRLGLKNMLIQRVHYELKRLLAQDRNLEFFWTQSWDTEHKHDILCHMMPFYSYDIPHTCGPEPATCCQFDFARLNGMKYRCPWNIPPQEIHAGNVAARAEVLLDQYRKKSQLYKTRNVLIPLGDDFRYDDESELSAQFSNYARLFEYINGNAGLNTEIKFATLSEYFDAVHQDRQAGVALPTLHGDFFTYADRKDHYWSGYFTSRPFYKNLDRTAEAAMRAAEILYTLAGAAHDNNARSSVYPGLETARQHLGVFQHHDGVTGTSKDHVVVDYGGRLLTAVKTAEELSAKMAQALLGLPDSLVIDLTRPAHDVMPTRRIATLGGAPRTVVLFNPLASPRQQIVSIHVNMPGVTVVDPSGNTIASQCNPIFDGDQPQIGCELWFEVSLPALGIAVYALSDGNGPTHTHGEVVFYNSPVSKPIGYTVREGSGDFDISNDIYTLKFAGHRALLASASVDGKPVDLSLDFLTYGVRNMDDSYSGAYLFLPPGPASTYSPSTAGRARVTKGPLVEEVVTQIGSVVHTVRLFKSKASFARDIEISNIIDVSGLPNQEFVMRFKSPIKNQREFFTDLNGFQMRRRRTMDKIPLGGNVYPMPSAAYLEDSTLRMSLLTHSAMGVASLEDGWLETVLDRRLMRDDNRGLGQGVTDNKRTLLQYTLVLEPAVKSEANAHPALTLAATAASDRLNQPVLRFQGSGAAPSTKLVEPMRFALPCDVHLVNLRSMHAVPDSKVAVVLHRRGVAGSSCSCAGSQVHLKTLFRNLSMRDITEKTLSLNDAGSEVKRTLTLDLEPMEIHAYEVTLEPSH